MIYRADIIKRGTPEQIAEQWDASVRLQAARYGFVEAKLHQVYKLLNNDAYHFVSVVQWEDKASYAASVAQPGCYTFLERRPDDGPANTYVVANSAYSVTEAPGPDHVTVINPYRIPGTEAKKYADMWDASKSHMEKKEGFVYAQLLESAAGDDEYYFVSRAEWRSEELFLKQFEGADFRKIVAPYEGIFSISLTRLAAHILKE